MLRYRQQSFQSKLLAKESLIVEKKWITKKKESKASKKDEGKTIQEGSTVLTKNFSSSMIHPRGFSTEAIENVYQKKTPVEHVLLRPDTYVGGVEKKTEQTWIYDTTLDKNIKWECSYVPALYKIFDEILVNAADNRQRDSSMSCIKVDIDKETQT
jgi:DNA topoisomerase-2